jgi:hypothetical protein
MGWKDALGGIGGKVFGGLKSSEQGYDQAMASVNSAYGRANKAIKPYGEYGVSTLADLKRFTSGDPTQAVLSDPTYKFGYDRGVSALNNSAGSRNRLLSGRALKELAQFGQDYGMSKYDQILGRKMGLADWGYNTGAGKLADLAIGQGNALAGLQTGKGDAKQNRYQGYLDLGMNIGGKMMGMG